MRYTYRVEVVHDEDEGSWKQREGHWADLMSMGSGGHDEGRVGKVQGVCVGLTYE